MVKIEHYLEVVYGHGFYKNVGLGTEVIQSLTDGQTDYIDSKRLHLCTLCMQCGLIMITPNEINGSQASR